MKKILHFSLLMLTTLVITACGITVNLAEPKATPEVVEPATTEPTEPTMSVVQPTAQIILPQYMEITVYFMDENRFIAATDPYEVAVTRVVPARVDLPRTVLDAYFKGPTPEEESAGLRSHTSGFTHVREMTITDGIARVYLGGVCANNGAAYSVAALIMKNLNQFPEISAVKIYDENDSTEDPDSPNSSIPYCLEP